MQTAASILALAAMLVVVAGQDRTYSLDLVDSPITSDEEFDKASRLSGQLLFSQLSRGSYEGWSPPRLPLTVTLLSPDGGIYAAGDEITYEFRVRNSSSQPVYVPTSRQGHLFTVRMPRATRAIFGLSFHDDVLGTQMIAVEGTYGAESVANSLLLLRPNESVSIRAREGISVQSSGTARPFPWLRVVNVRLDFGLYPVDGEPHGTVLSENSIAIELRSSPE